MNTYLSIMAFIGVWNAINMIARMWYKEPCAVYTYNIVIGFFAIYFLVAGY